MSNNCYHCANKAYVSIQDGYPYPSDAYCVTCKVRDDVDRKVVDAVDMAAFAGKCDKYVPLRHRIALRRADATA